MITKRMTSGAALVLALAAMARGGRAGQPGEGQVRGPSAEIAQEPQASGAAKAAYLAGKRAASDKEARGFFAQGIKVARARLAADPDDPEGLLWLAANLGAEALTRGKLFALGVIPEMKRLLLRLDAVAPDYENAAAARTLGVLHAKAPPVISIGSDKEARRWFERALERAGDDPANRILAAEFFFDEGEKARAVDLAKAYLAAPARPEDSPDAPEWERMAREIVGER